MARQCKATSCSLLFGQLWRTKSQCPQKRLLRRTEAKDYPILYVIARLHVPVDTASGLPQVPDGVQKPNLTPARKPMHVDPEELSFEKQLVVERKKHLVYMLCAVSFTSPFPLPLEQRPPPIHTHILIPARKDTVFSPTPPLYKVRRDIYRHGLLGVKKQLSVWALAFAGMLVTFLCLDL